ncbi:MAG: GDP-mannose 4,6-dehydratase [Oscillospiraceae bacterium]|nr:GDP-mannose 4,6-dehydratase [Oscillospiraceae bacterium]
MRCLITGAAGFVGGYAIERLAGNNAEIHAAILPQESFSHRGCTVHTLDLCDAAETEALLKAVRPDAILHLAAQSSVGFSWKMPQKTVDVNISGTLHLLEAAQKLSNPPRILLVGSGEVYGTLRPEQIPVSEDTLPQPNNFYAATKLAAESLAQVCFRACGLPVICVRAFNHFGPRQRPDFVIADFCKQAAEIEAGLQEPVIRTGNLAVQRDFTDVRDIVHAYEMLLANGTPGEIYNVGSGRATALSDILDEIAAQTGCAFRTENDPQKLRPADTPVIAADIRKLQRDTGWTPQIPLQQTIADTLTYWRQTVKENARA